MSKTLDRLSKLIAQADNAGTPEEARTYMERAEKMSAEIGVELAVARAHHASKQREQLVTDHKSQVADWTAKPMVRGAMMDLFLAIARAHDVECLISGGNYIAYCTGFPTDIEICEKLFAMASLQMVREADKAIRRGEQKKGAWPIDGRIYRRHFYEGFIAAIGGRLWQNRRDAIQASEDAGNTGTEVALRDKSKEVKDAFKEQVEHRKQAGTLSKGHYRSELDKQNRDYGGDAHVDGSRAGHRANLGLHDRDLDAANSRAIGGRK